MPLYNNFFGLMKESCLLVNAVMLYRAIVLIVRRLGR